MHWVKDLKLVDGLDSFSPVSVPPFLQCEMGMTPLSTFQENNKDYFTPDGSSLTSLSFSLLFYSFYISIPGFCPLFYFHSEFPAFVSFLMPLISQDTASFSFTLLHRNKKGPPGSPGLNCYVWHHWIFRSQRQQLQSDLAGDEAQSA